ncbi:acyltransferase family protein [Tellurirhabdus bombi]|uniref:acyltransferase family protein n=1 Tax=Tellurirhabdus bombi TaxID=2907205 RepID=UPI001F238D96|nr:acyltransferase [Tellurirhabdus bombi]
MAVNQTNYLPQLDGLRCLAVLFVLLEHWLGARNILPLGPLGVTLFFVLSGFLITRILLTSKEKLAGQQGGFKRYIKTFYIRRTLRIFPLYYAILILLAVLNVPPVRETLVWSALYATNIYMIIHRTWLGSIDHFWSLAVEEQVYLVVPFVLFFLPKRLVPWLVIGTMLVSFAVRYMVYRWPLPLMVSYVATPACLDSFGLGALLAYWYLYKPTLFQKIFSNTWLIISSVALYSCLLALSMNNESFHKVYPALWDRFCASVMGAFIIGGAVIGYKGVGKWLLENPFSQYIGRISYGLYLIHAFVYNAFYMNYDFVLMSPWNEWVAAIPALDNWILLKLAYCLSITVVLASLSWYLLENPINRLKDKLT